MPQTQPHRPEATGEEACSARLAELGGERLVVLHDRRMPASRGTIDHLAVTPRGVFVIDVKLCSGKLERRNFGDAIRPDVRLYVGGHDRTTLLHGVEERAEVVRDALSPAWFVDSPVRGVLCCVGAEWGLFPAPFKLGNVLVTY